jgi:hypothetical protein
LRWERATLKREVREDSVEMHSHDYMMSLTSWDVEGKARRRQSRMRIAIG